VHNIVPVSCANPKIIEWVQLYRAITEIAGISVTEHVVYQMLLQGS